MNISYLNLNELEQQKLFKPYPSNQLMSNFGGKNYAWGNNPDR